VGSSAAKRIVAALVLCLAAAAVSGLLLLQHHGEPLAVSTVNQGCGGDGTTSGCDEVARSSWSSLAGFPVAGLGLVFYLSLALALGLALLGSPELRDPAGALVLMALAFGLLFDLFLLGVQVVVIKAYCRFCIGTYVLGLLALAALLPAWRAVLGALPVLAGREGRLALGAWLLGTAALAGSVFASDVALRYRAAGRQANLLGRPIASTPPAPAVAATPAPGTAAPVASATPGAPATAEASSPGATEPPAGPQDVSYWRAHAQKLQETLDDPRKLEMYFSEKAQREFATAKPVAIDTASAPARGPASAPVKVVEFSDFLCPFCRNLGLALAQFVPQAGGRVVVYYKNYPLDSACNPKLKQSVHPGACNVALGAVCAQRQGKFEAYHDRVFGTEFHNPQVADVLRVAGEAGLNAAAMAGCLDDPKTKEALDAQIAEANRLEINSTPTVYINGKKLPRINDFVAVVDKEARKKGFPPLPQQ
jgi:protein-disulfide isomerase/uncharacterized membrane protein